MKLILTRNSDSACLLTANENQVKIVLEEISIHARRVKLLDNVYLNLNNTLSKNDAIYPFARSQVKTFTQPAGIRDICITNQLSTPNIPVRVVVALVSNAAYAGSKALNPYNFQPFHINYVDLKVNSKSVLTRPMTLNVANREYLEAYYNTLISMNYVGRDDGYYVDRDEFINGNFLLGFDLTPTLSNGPFADRTQTGKVDIELRFDRELEQTLSVIVYSQYQNHIIINKVRRVVKDFS